MFCLCLIPCDHGPAQKKALTALSMLLQYQYQSNLKTYCDILLCLYCPDRAWGSLTLADIRKKSCMLDADTFVWSTSLTMRPHQTTQTDLPCWVCNPPGGPTPTLETTVFWEPLNPRATDAITVWPKRLIFCVNVDLRGVNYLFIFLVLGWPKELLSL